MFARFRAIIPSAPLSRSSRLAREGRERGANPFNQYSRAEHRAPSLASLRGPRRFCARPPPLPAPRRGRSTASTPRELDAVKFKNPTALSNISPPPLWILSFWRGSASLAFTFFFSAFPVFPTLVIYDCAFFPFYFDSCVRFRFGAPRFHGKFLNLIHLASCFSSIPYSSSFY